MTRAAVYSALAFGVGYVLGTAGFVWLISRWYQECDG